MAQNGRYSTFFPGRTVLILACLAGSLEAAAAGAGNRVALPVDEAGKDASFVSFRANLLAAVVSRDVNKVVLSASHNIKLSFGGHAGRQEFRNFLTLSQDDLADEYKHQAAERREGYWDGLEEVLRMGGRFTMTGVFEAPYTWTEKLAETDDPFKTYFVTGDDVPVLDRASRFGNVITRLSHNIVTAVDGGEGTKFVKVKLSRGGSGFIDSSALRSALDFRAVFKQQDGKWLIDTFVKGD